MEWKFKEDIPQQGSSDGFWYDLVYGGYIVPEEILDDKEQLEKVKEAILILIDFENALVDNDITPEF